MPGTISVRERGQQRPPSAQPGLSSVTVLAGRDKSGAAEACGFSARPGQVVGVVGATGSGKSRLLADIECLAQGDTPSGRRVLVEGLATGGGPGPGLVAQVSQNMNFVMDLSVAEFIGLHARSRGLRAVEDCVRRVMDCALALAGEGFSPSAPLTQLSGGQSRALMIADVAWLSAPPVVLIEELENAGIDKHAALDLLTRRGKVVILSTHDPALVLLGHQRVVMGNGGSQGVLLTSPAERRNCGRLRLADQRMMALRSRLRAGGRIEEELAPGAGL